ncbi:unnamed protein product [Caenorhabditis bovis]|uniref:Glycosyltransferase family 92 protein n=1 Tax=Caenorhabditis bovis TaxID=2654633 RepID=A0A8S1E8U0_9PELO|nr:unnamed protein product [Caenorhabditis bovis]
MIHRAGLVEKQARAQLIHATPSVFSAFAYHDSIVVTLSSENHLSRFVYCRYFDCKFNEIPQPFKTTVLPESAVFCGRRIGAAYITITSTLEDALFESPVRIQKRLETQHFFTVCVDPLIGENRKYLKIAEFIEYYKLQGATFFHFYVRNITDYDRFILDDYARTGEIEVIRLRDHYWREDFMWMQTQTSDCHFRSRSFSKWTAFLNIDDRLEINSSHYSTLELFLEYALIVLGKM